MLRKGLSCVVPFLAVGLLSATASVCSAGGVPTGASSHRASGYRGSSFYSGTAYSSGFFYGGYYSPAPALSPSRSYYYAPRNPTSNGAGEEQEATNGSPAPARIELRLPADAELWFEGDPTSQAGGVRNFVSPRLEPGRSYTYSIRAHWTSVAGQDVEVTRTVKVQAGRRIVVDFLAP